jgi:hypothetical protein
MFSSLRPLRYDPGTEHFAKDSFFYPLRTAAEKERGTGLVDGERITLLSWEARRMGWRVRGAHGTETTLNLLQMEPAQEVLTIHGWLHEAHPASLREVVTLLHCVPHPTSMQAEDCAARGHWRHLLQVLRRNGGTLPAELRARAAELEPVL